MQSCAGGQLIVASLSGLLLCANSFDFRTRETDHQINVQAAAAAAAADAGERVGCKHGFVKLDRWRCCSRVTSRVSAYCMGKITESVGAVLETLKSAIK